MAIPQILDTEPDDLTNDFVILQIFFPMDKYLHIFHFYCCCQQCYIKYPYIDIIMYQSFLLNRVDFLKLEYLEKINTYLSF